MELNLLALYRAKVELLSFWGRRSAQPQAGQSTPRNNILALLGFSSVDEPGPPVWLVLQRIYTRFGEAVGLGKEWTSTEMSPAIEKAISNEGGRSYFNSALSALADAYVAMPLGDHALDHKLDDVADNLIEPLCRLDVFLDCVLRPPPTCALAPIWRQTISGLDDLSVQANGDFISRTGVYRALCVEFVGLRQAAIHAGYLSRGLFSYVGSVDHGLHSLYSPVSDATRDDSLDQYLCQMYEALLLPEELGPPDGFDLSAAANAAVADLGEVIEGQSNLSRLLTNGVAFVPPDFRDSLRAEWFVDWGTGPLPYDGAGLVNAILRFGCTAKPPASFDVASVRAFLAEVGRGAATSVDLSDSRPERKRGGSKSRQSKWKPLLDVHDKMTAEDSNVTMKRVVNRYNQKYARSIADGKRDKATTKALANALQARKSAQNRQVSPGSANRSLK